MKINNKEIFNWSEEDLKTLLHNDTYRENNFIDYKMNFAPLECADKMKKKEKQNEFRNDVCAFANTDGGYIFYGIAEDSGMAGTLSGISISNPDRFELDRRNELQSIQPVIPEVDFFFIPIKNADEQTQKNYDSAQNCKYVVVLHIHRGFYKPYITEEQEGKFNFYTRHGNKKQAMTYTEMKNNFLNTATLSDDIKNFRKERMDEYANETKEPFALVHLIPITFKNSADYFPMFELYKQKKLNFYNLFNSIIGGQIVPNVDGVYFPDYSGHQDYEQLQIFNNGSVELKMKLDVVELRNHLSNIEHYLILDEFLNELEKLISDTSEMYQQLGRSTTMYVCVTIVGAKGLWNYNPNIFVHSKVDRNQILCMPIEIRNIINEDCVKTSIKNCVQTTKYSVGIQN